MIFTHLRRFRIASPLKFTFILLSFSPILSWAGFGDQSGDGIGFIKKITELAQDPIDEESIVRNVLRTMEQECIEVKALLPQDVSNREICDFALVTFIKAMNQIGSTAIQQAQNNSLMKSLRGHGLSIQDSIELKYTNMREILIELSKVNKQRILEQMHYDPSHLFSLPTDVQKLIEELVVLPEHNTSADTRLMTKDLPIFSCYQLERFGFHGLNTHEFNKNLQTDDNVFFFALFSNKKELNKSIQKGVKSEYGEFTLTIDREYGMSTAFLSPFVMYISDLFDVAEMVAPEFLGNITKIRESLYKYDLVLEDYEEIVRAALAEKLHRTGLENNANLLAVLKNLTSPDTDVIASVTKEIAKLPHYEYKIPAVVPGAVWHRLRE